MLQDIVPVHIGQHQIEQDDIVGVQLGVADPIGAAMRQVADKVLRLQHDLDPCCRHDLVFDHQHPHRVTFKKAGAQPSKLAQAEPPVRNLEIEDTCRES